MDRVFPAVKGYLTNVEIEQVDGREGKFDVLSLHMEDGDERAKVSLPFNGNSLDTLTLLSRLVTAASKSTIGEIKLTPYGSKNGEYINTGIGLRVSDLGDTVVEAIYKGNDFWKEENGYIKIVEVNNKKQYDRSTILNTLKDAIPTIIEKLTGVPDGLQATGELSEEVGLSEMDKMSNDEVFGADEDETPAKAEAPVKREPSKNSDVIDDVIDDML